MQRTAAAVARLEQRMQRSFARRVVLLLVLVGAIGGACVVRAGEAPRGRGFCPDALATPLDVAPRQGHRG